MIDIKKNLAFAHKIIAHLKMDDHTYTHISARSKLSESFFISPFGIVFAHVSPENLTHINYQGVLHEDSGSTHVNKTGLSIHSALYKAREDINCVIHLHTKETIAISCFKEGLLPISQHALHFYNKISYHSYNSLVLGEKEESLLLIQDLGFNNIMFLRNHGFITTGKTIWEALFYAYHLQKACEIQVITNSFNSSDLILPLPYTCEKAREDLLSFEKDLGRRDFESWKAFLK
jgi:ribulose-5-phosphate 4-epimerase/fuculose-1-phosphate aldolase